jgi:predicted peroxiredoxin
VLTLIIVMYLALNVKVSLKSVTIKKCKIPYVISEYLMTYGYKVKLFLHVPWGLVGYLR